MRAITLAGMMAIVSGTACILAGILRLGFVTELLSKPIRHGYMNGIALTVLISQLPKLFGFTIESEGPLRSLWAIAGAITEGKTSWVALGLGLGTLTVILLLESNKRLPGILIAVVGAMAVAGALDLGRTGRTEPKPGLDGPWCALRSWRPFSADIVLGSTVAGSTCFLLHTEREDDMPESVYKVIELIGTSNDSWEKAAANAVEQAAKSLRDLRVAEVVKLDIQLDAKGKVEAYRAKLNVSFKFEGT